MFQYNLASRPHGRGAPSSSNVVVGWPGERLTNANIALAIILNGHQIIRAERRQRASKDLAKVCFISTLFSVQHCPRFFKATPNGDGYLAHLSTIRTVSIFPPSLCNWRATSNATSPAKECPASMQGREPT